MQLGFVSSHYNGWLLVYRPSVALWQRLTLIFLTRQVMHPVLLRVYLGRFLGATSGRGGAGTTC